MQDEKLEQRAIEVYETLCGMLDKLDFHYEKVGKDADGDYLIRFDMTGDDLPMSFVMFMDVDRQLIRVMSQMPFAFPEDKRVEGAIVTCRANYKMVDGNFDYNFLNGRTVFKITTSYRDSLIDEELLLYMIKLAASMVDEFNDKFYAVGMGVKSVEQFLAKY